MHDLVSLRCMYVSHGRFDVCLDLWVVRKPLATYVMMVALLAPPPHTQHLELHDLLTTTDRHQDCLH